jgi:streptogramin lyase
MHSHKPLLLAGLVFAALVTAGFTTSARHQSVDAPRSSDWLSLLPNGDTKSRFILDCTGCHQFDSQIARPSGQRRTAEDWKAATLRMLGFAGATTGFPVIAHDRDAEGTAAWLSEHAAKAPSIAARPLLPAGAQITEYDLPEPQDLAHDVAIDSGGAILVTGMFSHVMYTLDTTTRRFDAVPIPVSGNANPRAVEVDSKGDWWVVLGSPRSLARYAVSRLKWDIWPVGMYAHSVAIDPAGQAWVNGHFTKDPIQIVRVDPSTGGASTVDLPMHPALSREPGGPIPYEIRSAPDGVIWMSELGGNRIISHNPGSGASKAYGMPAPHMGPRRFDIDRDGVLWIPAYAANELVRFDPRSGEFIRHVLPISDALPYVVRVDPSDGTVWIGSGAADALFAFAPATGRFTTYPLPSRGAMVRHMAIDPRSHDVWIAYGASPGRIPSRVARLRRVKVD